MESLGVQARCLACRMGLLCISSSCSSDQQQLCQDSGPLWCKTVIGLLLPSSRWLGQPRHGLAHPHPSAASWPATAPLSCSAVFCILQATDAHVAPGLTLYLGSIRLNMGAFFSMSGMVMNLRQAVLDDDACLEDVTRALVGLRTAMTGNSLTSHCRP